MLINTNNMVSLTEANRNFSKIAKMVEENGSAIILKNNAPRYLVIEFSALEKAAQAPDEDISIISQRLLSANREAYEILAK